jgi:hypothetical protein
MIQNKADDGDRQACAKAQSQAAPELHDVVDPRDHKFSGTGSQLHDR